MLLSSLAQEHVMGQHIACYVNCFGVLADFYHMML